MPAQQEDVLSSVGLESDDFMFYTVPGSRAIFSLHWHPYELLDTIGIALNSLWCNQEENLNLSWRGDTHWWPNV